MFTINLVLLSGVDVFNASYSCRFCGTVMDTKGVHALSCVAGGDILLRHNEVRDIIFKFARRGNLRPTLEKAGLLAEDGVFVNLRRPADVLIESLDSTAQRRRNGTADGRTQRVALDIKVINALGADHFDRTLQSSQAAGRFGCIQR